MLRHARDRGRTDLLRVAVSARTRGDVPFAAELETAGVLVALTREDGPSRAAARLSGAEIAPLVPAEGPCFVCGSAAFAEAATDLLMSTGVEAGRIRVERFGPTS
jgi:ferredoxin-NADP reductase